MNGTVIPALYVNHRLRVADRSDPATLHALLIEAGFLRGAAAAAAA